MKISLQKKLLLLLNCALLVFGSVGGPLIMRLYYMKGGKQVWILSITESAGFPFILLPLLISYLHRRRKSGPGSSLDSSSKTKIFYINIHIFLASAVLGLLTGLVNFLITYGVSRIPVSTSSLILASELGFTACFAFILVKQKFNSFSIIAVFLLTLGAVILAFHSSSDRPNNESNREYFTGFIMTIVASALYGFVLPAVELVYKKSNQNITYTLVMEMQMVMSFFATAFCGVGMLLHGDFKGMEIEANEFELGKSKYVEIIISSMVIWQSFFMGMIGVVFCGSSLLSGIINAASLPLTETLAVLLYHETFHIEKSLSLIFSLLGFISYFYGEFKFNQTKKSINQPNPEVDYICLN